MAYRDEAEALRARVEALEQSQAELAAERDALAAERDALEAELEGEADDGPSTDGPSAAASVAADDEAVVRQVEADVAARFSAGESFSWWEQAWDFVKVAAVEAWPVTVIVTLTVVGYGLMALAHAGVDQAYQLTWPAKVTSVEGAPFMEGTACHVNMTIRTNRVASYLVDGLVLRCGDEEVYSWSDAIERRRSNDDDDDGPDKRCRSLEVIRDEQGHLRARLRCQDVGGRLGGRPEMKLDTSEGGLAVWREQPPFLRVQLAVDELSSPIDGPAPFTDPAPHPVSMATLFE